MRMITRWISALLMVALVFSAFPCAVGAKEAVAEENAVFSEERMNTRAVSVGSISVPAYSGGTSSGWMTYDCGQYLGLANAGTQSKMMIVKNTTATQFLNYGTSLKDKGYTVVLDIQLTDALIERHDQMHELNRLHNERVDRLLDTFLKTK